jgi:hypothetical protein
MAKTMKKVRVASNANRTHSKKKAKAARKGSHSHMAKKNKTNNPHHKARSHKSTNPHHKKRSRNPSETFGSAKDIATSAVYGLGTAVLTAQVPQLLLQANNTGIGGYAANAGTAIAAVVLAKMFGGPVAARAAMVGGSVIILDRILTEQFSQIGPYLQLSGLGDATAVRRMGTIRDGSFLHPTMNDANGNMIVPDPVTQAALAAVLAKYPQLAAPAAVAVATGGAGMGAAMPSNYRRQAGARPMVSARFQSRFNHALN